jgi:hypothetical protein
MQTLWNSSSEVLSQVRPAKFTVKVSNIPTPYPSYTARDKILDLILEPMFHLTFVFESHDIHEL